MKTWNFKGFFKRNKINIIISVIVFLGLLGVFIYNGIYKSKQKYTVVNGYVEKTSEMTSYILKEEETLTLSKNESIIPIVEQGKRAGKNQSIAMYKNSKYEEYLKQIEVMDTNIKTMVKDLPKIYSNEISNIDNQISELIKKSENITSYVEMQDIKNKADELSYKKVLILGKSSPVGSKIRDTIEQREKLEKESKNSTDIIKANKSGMISYKIDNLENLVNLSEVQKYDVQKYEQIISEYSKNGKSNFGIKIINNYEAYLVVKEPFSENSGYIKEGRNYTIRSLDNECEDLTGNLVKIVQTDDNSYCVFNIRNNIESLVDIRTLSVQIVWTKVQGMAVPNNAIKKNEQSEYSFVILIKGGEYVQLPVNIKISSDSISIVENMNIEDKKAKNIQVKDTLNLYDQLVID